MFPPRTIIQQPRGHNPLGIPESMKNPRWFTRNHLSSHVRIATAVTLTSAAAAMAFVAAKPSSPSLLAKSDGKGEAKLGAKYARSGAFASHLQTPLAGGDSTGAGSRM